MSNCKKYKCYIEYPRVQHQTCEKEVEYWENSEWNWQILSINVDENITGKSFSKKDEIEWAVKHNLPMEYTMTCWTPVKYDDYLYHCGECYACLERQTGFKDANCDDHTKYFNQQGIKS